MATTLPISSRCIASPSAGTITAQRVASTTPGGAKDRARITITTADASLAAGEYLYARTRLEGQNVADFRWGSAGAKQAVLRFLFKGPSGTYAVRLTNSAKNRSYVATFSPAAADTDVIIAVAVPGDTSGTWLTDTGAGIEVCIVLACGSTFHGTGGWQAGDVLGTSAVSNGMATGSAVFEMGEFGFFLDVGEAGTDPGWELPDPTSALRDCRRYYYRAVSEGDYFTFTGAAAFGRRRRKGFILYQLPAPLRASPSFSVSSNGHFGVGSGANFYQTTNMFSAAPGVERFLIGFNISGGRDGRKRQQSAGVCQRGGRADLRLEALAAGLQPHVCSHIFTT